MKTRGRPKCTDKRLCLTCGSDTTYRDKNGWISWHHYGNGWMCHKCHNRLIADPKNNPRKYRFGSKGPRFFGPKKMLTGRCSRCPNNIYDGSCKMTAMHHCYYLRISPLCCREELCQSCHIKLNPSAFYEKGHPFYPRKRHLYSY